MNKESDVYKKVIVTVLTSVCFMMCVSCMGTPAAQEAPAVHPVSIEEVSSAVDTVRLTALIETAGDGSVMLVENWNSKSRKSYEIVGDMANTLRSFSGKRVEAEVIFLEKKTWSGSVVVVKVIEIRDNDGISK